MIARLDPLLEAGIDLTEGEIRDLVQFVEVALLDDDCWKPEALCPLVPTETPGNDDMEHFFDCAGLMADDREVHEHTLPFDDCGRRPRRRTCGARALPHHGSRPDDAMLPTMDVGQEFSFVATDDCVELRFHVEDTTLTKVPNGWPGR
jgi:hypothetical protein